MTAHTYGRDCPACPPLRRKHDGTPILPSCDHQRYGGKALRFVLDHEEPYLEAYFAPDHRASRAMLRRLDRERRTLPPGHRCTCRIQDCPEYQKRGVACLDCKVLHAERPVGPDTWVEIGRTGLVHPPIPDVVLLDLACALATGISDPWLLARYLNGREDEAA